VKEGINMNMQAMIKQAQKIQKEMLNEKNEIDNTKYIGKSSFVTIEMMGTGSVSSVKIECEELNKDDIEALEDMIMVAINDAKSKIDSDTEKKLGKYTKGMPGLF
jgi:hypothetical protein